MLSLADSPNKYCALRMMKSEKPIAIALPYSTVPYGSVRYGTRGDHQPFWAFGL
jgi:hypothetical protein